MSRNRPLSAQAIGVLRALAADPSRWRYGYHLGVEVRLKSGSLYPILDRVDPGRPLEKVVPVRDLPVATGPVGFAAGL